MPASAAPIPVFGTGLDASGSLLAPGSSDPHYVLTLNALGPSTSTFVAGGASSVESGTQAVPTGWPFTPGAWAIDALAQWIGPTTDVVGIQGTVVDTFYTYQTTFDLSGFDPSTVQLTGHWTADNYLTMVSLNGAPVYSAVGCGSPGNFAFSSLTPFTISSGFQPGLNTLTFNVTNSTCFNMPPRTNPTGLLVDISGTGVPGGGSIPEPGTLLFLVTGLSVTTGVYWRRRRTP